ncbi:sensor histidine kinase [Streptomyces sp. LBUM 1476]|uniref:histidine kinase n=1 Tax=Streptomyces acidiscabies TaxID=42234 RepID=A0AAP6BIE1_9ACTN|nr:sensor histidine kinase [Streptomyces acidiscabies]MBP5942273.1 sensor histidine kinase [Streptomyces sp. LBUM 1476]MBZ3913806.1 sensor histidine kinase [Streptomyces acidiscabies]MDX2965281.1 sensor histidine kinase [Streptomyces acidiscabies]MDX3022103.1 sensor histidine kinase [Streptomyces acidiscabies]MDX3793667.1 sensor histidine kinase [Streptomyces acidiscabies]
MTSLTTTTSAGDFGGTGPLVARFSRVGQRLRQADQDRPWVLDTAVVVLVFLLFCLPDLVHGDAGEGDGPPRFRLAFTQLPPAAMLLFQLALVLPLLWRRRRPMAAFGAIAVVFVVQWSLGAVLRADVALFIALYSLALHGWLRRLPWACGIMVAGMVLVAVRVSPVVSVGDALFFLLSTATAALALGLMVRTRRAQLAGLRERAARLEIERDQRSRLATATERARVAREMHDIVGHNLAVMITLADAGAYATDTAPERGKEALRLIGDTGRTALGELRRVLGVLREASDGAAVPPELSPQPALVDIEALCDGVRGAGLEVVYRTVGEVDALDRGVQLAVYRIVQEALTNTLKHAGAGTRVKLSLIVEDTRLVMRVRDDGPAGRPGPRDEEGHGLVGMRERAALYGGDVSAGPAHGGGWLVEATLHLAPRAGAR